MQVDVFGLVFLLNQSYQLHSDEEKKNRTYFLQYNTLLVLNALHPSMFVDR